MNWAVAAPISNRQEVKQTWVWFTVAILLFAIMNEQHMQTEYDIEILDFGGDVGIAIETEEEDEATAINWAWYFLGKYRGDKARIWRGHTNPRDKSTFVTEISSAGDARR